MTPRVRLAAVAALAAAVVVAGALLLAGGADGREEGPLAWSESVRVFESSIATDRVLTGRLENASLEEIELDVRDARVLDASGREVRSAVSFLEAFAHGIYPWSQRPEEPGDFERRRLGEIATIKPGESVPVAVSWRVPEGAAQPETVDFGPASLNLP